jgi:hypothetical protein
VTPEQISGLRLPTAPRKATDGRSFNGVDGDPNATVQAEAIAPDVLADIVREAILARFDMDILRERIAWQEREQQKLKAYADYVLKGYARWARRADR